MSTKPPPGAWVSFQGSSSIWIILGGHLWAKRSIFPCHTTICTGYRIFDMCPTFDTSNIHDHWTEFAVAQLRALIEAHYLASESTRACPLCTSRNDLWQRKCYGWIPLETGGRNWHFFCGHFGYRGVFVNHTKWTLSICVAQESPCFINNFPGAGSCDWAFLCLFIISDAYWRKKIPLISVAQAFAVCRNDRLSVLHESVKPLTLPWVFRSNLTMLSPTWFPTSWECLTILLAQRCMKWEAY